MKLFSFLASLFHTSLRRSQSVLQYSVKPAWSFSVAHTLWRILFSRNNLIVGEERDTDKKVVSFFCVNAADGKVLWKDKTFNEKWWLGVEGVTNEHLYLHGFKKPDMPEHQGIIAVDLLTGKEVWRNAQYSFLSARYPFVFAFKDLFERRVYCKIHQQNGKIVEELSSPPEESEQNVEMERFDFQFPTTAYSNLNIVYQQLEEFTPNNIEDIKSVEYAECEKYFIANVHAAASAITSASMKNSLYIIDTSTKKKVYSDVLNESTPYPAPGSFFLDGRTVYYIKERKTLVALKLP